MKIYFYFLSALLLGVTSCSFLYAPQEKIVRFPLQNGSNVIRLEKKEGQKSIHSISLHLKGNFNGNTTVSVGGTSSGFLHSYNFPDGKVARSIENMDWYSDSCFIKIDPPLSDSAELTIHYRFHD